MEAEAEEAATASTGQLLSPLPDHLALGILAGLPWPLLAKLRCVCRAWRDALQPPAMTSLRASMGFSEAWPLFYMSSMRPRLKGRRNRPSYLDKELHLRGNLLLFDPLMHHYHVVPPLESFRCLTIVGTHGSEIIAVEKCLQDVSSYDVFSFNAALGMNSSSSNRWKPWNAATTRRFDSVASCILGGYLYVAGGVNEYSRNAERLQIDGVFASFGGHSSSCPTRMWESLPSLKDKRVLATGFAFEGRFYVVGGVDLENIQTGVNSGEVWDPSIGGEWTLVPELWPVEYFAEDTCRPQITVVRECLYALSITLGRIMYYESGTKRWISMCGTPSDFDPYSFMDFRAVGAKFWLVRSMLCSTEEQNIFTAAVPNSHTVESLPWDISQNFEWRLRFLNFVLTF